MKKQFNFKRLIAITLVVANVFASTGFSVLANSVANIVYDSAINEKELKNYYYLYQEEKYRYEEKTRYYAEYDTEDNISDDLKEKVKINLMKPSIKKTVLKKQHLLMMFPQKRMKKKPLKMI